VFAGITAFILGCGFTIAMFFAPIFSSIPSYATGPALIFVGTLIMSHAAEIDWSDLKVAFPSFLTIALMPLTYRSAPVSRTATEDEALLWMFGLGWQPNI
jgi:AGZA family xanthine/uracil permease-like MFS transporter